MATPKKIIMKDLELADKEIARLMRENKGLEKENKELKKKLEHYENTEAIQKANANSIIYWTYTISKI